MNRSLFKLMVTSIGTVSIFVSCTQAVEKPLSAKGESIIRGKVVYAKLCAACHQADGMGIDRVFPPLTKSDWINGSDKKLALIILNGLSGPITVNGREFNGIMPPLGATLDDQQIADVLTYVRTGFGNNSTMVSKETVEQLRKQYNGNPIWTVERLESELTEGARHTPPTKDNLK